MLILDYSLYMVTDRTYMRTQTLEACVEQALEGGVSLVQLREKELDIDQFVALGRKVKRICDAYAVPLIINDNWEVALALGAYGVHVGQQDMPVSVVRNLVGPDCLLGVSVTNVAQARKAQADGADYLGVGAMFRTQTKTDASLVSLATLGDIRKAVPLLIVTIGGMNTDTIPLCAPYGVQGFAVVSALIDQPEVSVAARVLRQCTDKYSLPSRFH
ncbi:MAG: thiamine phosphate synthase [Sphaerochaetaceae bacterium]